MSHSICLSSVFPTSDFPQMLSNYYYLLMFKSSTKKLIGCLSLWVGSLTVRFTVRMIGVDYMWKPRCHYFYFFFDWSDFTQMALPTAVVRIKSLGALVLYSHEKSIDVRKGPNIQFACVQLVSIFSMVLQSPTGSPSRESPYLLQGITPPPKLCSCCKGQAVALLQEVGKGIWGFSLFQTRIFKQCFQLQSYPSTSWRNLVLLIPEYLGFL